MGYSNVAAVYQTWPHLPHRAHRLLVFMALTALDGPSPRYWAGRCRLAGAIGYDGCTQEPDCPQRTSHRKVSGVVAELVAAGAVERMNQGARGRQSEYALNLWVKPVDKPPERGARASPGDLLRAP